MSYRADRYGGIISSDGGSHEAAYVSPGKTRSPLEAKFSKQCKYSWAILWAVNRCSNTRLILRRSSRSSALIASTASRFILHDKPGHAMVYNLGN